MSRNYPHRNFKGKQRTTHFTGSAVLWAVLCMRKSLPYASTGLTRALNGSWEHTILDVVQDKVKAEATHDPLWPFMNVKITPGFYTKGIAHTSWLTCNGLQSMLVVLLPNIYIFTILELLAIFISTICYSYLHKPKNLCVCVCVQCSPSCFETLQRFISKNGNTVNDKCKILQNNIAFNNQYIQQLSNAQHIQPRKHPKREREKNSSITLEVLISQALTSGLKPPQMKIFDSVGWNFSALILNSFLLLNICFPKIKWKVVT